MFQYLPHTSVLSVCEIAACPAANAGNFLAGQVTFETAQLQASLETNNNCLCEMGRQPFIWAGHFETYHFSRVSFTGIILLSFSGRRLYFSNMDMVEISGATYSWHKIEAIGLDGTGRRTVVETAEKPRGLFIDPKER